MKYHIYLFRHGQTYYNQKRYFTGWLDSHLTRKGKQQAQMVAKKLAKKQINISFQTTLSRSQDTLAEVLRFHPECRLVITDDRMLERNYGNLNGHSHSSIIEKFGQKQYDIWHRSYDQPPPGGESIQMVEERVQPFIHDLLSFMRLARVNVAISAHNNSMRAFRRVFEKLSVKEMMALENPWDDYFEYTVDISNTMPHRHGGRAHHKKRHPKAKKGKPQSRGRFPSLKKARGRH